MAWPSDPIDRTIVRLAVPALGTLAVEPLYVAVDTAIVGHLGTVALAGLAVAAQVLVLVASLCNFLAYGTTERIAFHRGARDPERAALVAVQALWLSVLIGVPLAALVAGAARPIVAVLGATGPSADAAVTYLHISAISIPAVLVTLVSHGVLRAEQRLRGLLAVVVAANVVNVVFELVAVWVFHWGIAGSAWSTVVVQLLSVGAYVHLLRPILRRSDARGLVSAELRRMLSVGGFLILRVGALMTTFTAATAVAARIDEPTLAAHQILSSGFLLLALSLDALAIPAQSLVAEALGAGDRRRAQHVARRVLALSIRCGLVIGLVVLVTSPWSPRLFSGDQAVVSRATGGLVVLAVLMVPGAIAFAYDGILIGAGQFRALSTMMIIVLVVYGPALVIPLVAPGTGLLGIWGALGAWMLARAVYGWQLARRRL